MLVQIYARLAGNDYYPKVFYAFIKFRIVN